MNLRHSPEVQPTIAVPRARVPPVPRVRAPVVQEAFVGWELRNRRVRAALSSEPWPQWHAFEDVAGGEEPALPLKGSPLFRLVLENGALSSADCIVQNVERESRTALQLLLRCDRSVTIEFSARLPTEDAHYMRLQLRLWSRVDPTSTDAWPQAGFNALHVFVFHGATEVEETRSAEKESSFGLDEINGLPVLIGKRFFVGVEHPMSSVVAAHGGNATHWEGVVGQITHTKRLSQPSAEKPWQYGAVFGVYAEISQARRAFASYLHAERPGRRSPMVHYNSWYDFYSYQDEGFNGGFKDRFKDEELIASLRVDVLNESNCLQRVEAFAEELVVKRQTKIDSFLWDDGWDDPTTLWEFDKERFPNRFNTVAAKATSFGAGTGVWLSPWGGYGFPQENRVKFGKKHGFETNWNSIVEVEAFSLAGPKYRKTFTDVALRFVREQSVNMFKFDGVAGDPHELAEEMEAMLGLISDLRTADNGISAASSERAGSAYKTNSKSGNGDREDDIWINLTTGTWASPFFLFWADTIWRGGADVGGTERRTHANRFLSKRQRWINWRNLMIFALVVCRSTFFPISQLMIHGVVLASHGDALHYRLNEFHPVDFAQEVWSFVGLGLQLQELYVAPRYMTADAWDILAEGLLWSRGEASVLRDTHWAFGDPSDHEVYCFASWDIVGARGFVFLHNPGGFAKESGSFYLADVLELPSVQRKFRLYVKIVKSVSTESRPGKNPLPDLCGGQAPQCTVQPEKVSEIKMLPTEVLVLAVSRTPQ